MNNQKDKTGLLLLFDAIALILSTFGTTFLLSVISGDGIDSNILILSCFFVGIKFLILGIGDFSGITKRFWAAAIAVLIADGIIFAVEMLMVFGISKKLLLIATAVDIIFIILSHLLWQKLFQSKAEPQKPGWLTENDNTKDDATINSLYSSLNPKAAISVSELEMNNAELKRDVIPIFESSDSIEDLRVQTKPVTVIQETPDEEPAEFILDLNAEANAESDNDHHWISALETSLDKKQSDESADEAIIEDNLTPEEDDLTPKEDNLTPEEDNPVSEDDITSPEAEEIAVVLNEDETEVQTETAEDTATIPGKNEESMSSEIAEEIYEEEPFFEEDVVRESEPQPETMMIEDADQQIAGLTESIEAFKSKVDAIRPDIDEIENVATSGAVIKERMDNILEKENIVDDVLEELIRFSEEINQKFNDLDEKEKLLDQYKAELDARAEALEELTAKLSENEKTQNKTFKKSKPFVADSEVIFDNGDCDIIADPEDLSIIRAFLNAKKDI